MTRADYWHAIDDLRANRWMLQVGVQNGGHDGLPVRWDWSEPLSPAGVIDRMEYLLNAGSYRESVGLPNAVKIRLTL